MTTINSRKFHRNKIRKLDTLKCLFGLPNFEAIHGRSESTKRGGYALCPRAEGSSEFKKHISNWKIHISFVRLGFRIWPKYMAPIYLVARYSGPSFFNLLVVGSCRLLLRRLQHFYFHIKTNHRANWNLKKHSGAWDGHYFVDRNS